MVIRANLSVAATRLRGWRSDGFSGAFCAIVWQVMPCFPVVRGSQYQTGCRSPRVRQHSQSHDKCQEGSKGGNGSCHTPQARPFPYPEAFATHKEISKRKRVGESRVKKGPFQAGAFFSEAVPDFPPQYSVPGR
jgi:hypothetical protein